MSISLCALAPYPLNTAPSQRFRIEQWIPRLAELGINVDLLPFADQRFMGMLHRQSGTMAKAALTGKALIRRLGHLARSMRYDAVLIHRSLCIAGPATLERLMALIGRPIIFDFDDAIFELHTTDANRRLAWMKFPGKTAAICRIAAHVVAGNSYLAAYACRHNSRVSIVPTSVDTERYRPLEIPKPKGRLIVGWTGSSTSQTHLEAFAPVLRKLTKWPNVELRVISDRAPVMPEVPFVWRRWFPETEVKDLAQFDIGIMPMPDDRWARGKCSLKALLYMSTGIPAVCSPVGTNCEIIRDGENGLLASTPEEWLSKLRVLADQPELRKRLGAAGRATVLEHYSMAKCAGLFARVVQQTVSATSASVGRLAAPRIARDFAPGSKPR
jgi:glycosyltransferase involved in cell wall biosynthesis